jgi:hypothetical protein
VDRSFTQKIATGPFGSISCIRCDDLNDRNVSEANSHAPALSAPFVASAVVVRRVSVAHIRPSADVRVARPNGGNRLKAAGHLQAVSERQSHKNGVPVSGRSCGPAIDPLLPPAVFSASDRSTLEPDLRSRRRGIQ